VLYMAGVCVIAGIIAAIEVPALSKDKKGLWTFSLLLLIGTGLAIAKCLNVSIPNPLDWIAAVFGPLSHLQPN
jgi:hypothetical protein